MLMNTKGNIRIFSPERHIFYMYKEKGIEVHYRSANFSKDCYNRIISHF
jgi:hypothetical protein